MTQISVEIVAVRQAHDLAKKLTMSSIPAIQALATHMLGLTRFMLAEVSPDELEHVSEYERSSDNQ